MTTAQVPSPVWLLPEGQRLVRSPDLLWRTIPGVAVVVLPPRGRDPVVLSGTGLPLWEQLCAPVSLDEIATRMAAQYGVRPDDVVDCLVEVLLELRQQGVVRDHDD